MDCVNNRAVQYSINRDIVSDRSTMGLHIVASLKIMICRLGIVDGCTISETNNTYIIFLDGETAIIWMLVNSYHC
jgi:hypothetical protein